jgi:hypothetical protein
MKVMIMRFILLIILIYSNYFIQAQNWDIIKNKIDSLYLLDTSSQSDFIKANSMRSDSADHYNKTMHFVFRSNCSIAFEFIKENSLPGLKEIGVDGTKKLWIIFQHCDSIPENQVAILEIMKKEVLRGNFPSKHYAYLYDRVNTGKGEKQLYGTQLMVKSLKSGYCSRPNKYPDTVDSLRIAIGLDSLSSYLNSSNELFRSMNPNPVKKAHKMDSLVKIINKEYLENDSVVNKHIATAISSFIDSMNYPIYWYVEEKNIMFTEIMKGADTTLVKPLLPRFKNAAEKDNSIWPSLAELIDIYSLETSKYQIYGTQFNYFNEEKRCKPIFDVSNLNERREKANLPKISCFCD